MLHPPVCCCAQLTALRRGVNESELADQGEASSLLRWASTEVAEELCACMQECMGYTVGQLSQIFGVLKRVKTFRDSTNSLENSAIDDGALGRAYHALRSYTSMLHSQRRRGSSPASLSTASTAGATSSSVGGGGGVSAAVLRAPSVRGAPVASARTPASAKVAHRSPLPRHSLNGSGGVAVPERRRQLVLS